MVIKIFIYCNSTKIVKLRLNGFFLPHQFLQLFFELKVHNIFSFAKQHRFLKMNKEYCNTNVMNADTKDKDSLGVTTPV
jgi:hypothetical protein